MATKKVKLKNGSNYLLPQTTTDVVMNVASGQEAVAIGTSLYTGNVIATTSIKKGANEVATESQINKTVANGSPTYTVNADAVTVTLPTVNIQTGATGTTTGAVMPLANSSSAGLMSHSDVVAITTLQSDVAALKGRNIRLLYATKQNPTAAEIQAFVQAQGYTDTSRWPGISVVVAVTYHIWHYYTNTSTWKDDGADTVNQFTNETAGIILGSPDTVTSGTHVNYGKVYAENDGTGSVLGWDNLTGRVSTAEGNITSLGTTVAGKQDKIDSSHKLSASLVSGLASVATTGSYNDLSNKPTIPTVNDATLTIQKNGTTIDTFTANSATNKTVNVVVPTATSDLTNDSGFIDSSYHDNTKQNTITSSAKLSASLVSGLANVATSGSYTDLTNKPTIPSVDGFITFEEIA